MEFTPFEQGQHNGSGPIGLVWPEPVDVAGLSLSGLRERLGLIKRAEARLAAMKTETLVAFSSRAGEGRARRAVLDELQMSRQQARREVQAASELSAVPDTLDALSAGEIPEAHAKQIAKAASQGPVDETVLVEAAKTEDFGTFTKTVRDNQHQQSEDDGALLLADKRKRRSLSFFKSPDDGMFIMNGRFDPVAGNRIEAALADEIRRQKNIGEENDPSAGDNGGAGGRPGALLPFEQRLADALENLVCADTKDRKPQGTTLILTADWDSLNQNLADARLVDGDPLPISEALRLACDADILPTVFDTNEQKLWVGRKYRSATEAQRAALIKRDKNCIGCGRTPVWCEAHHIVEWHKGGTTDIDNLVLVCTTCHHNIHDQNWTVKPTTTGPYQLEPPPPGPYADYPNPTKHPRGPKKKQAEKWPWTGRTSTATPRGQRAGPRQDPPTHRGNRKRRRAGPRQDPPTPPRDEPNPDELTLESDPFPDNGIGRGVPAGIQPVLLS